MNDLEREAEVRTVAVMLLGAVFAGMLQMIQNVLTGAQVSNPTDAMDKVTIRLKDGWRIRFTMTVLPPVADRVDEQ